MSQLIQPTLDSLIAIVTAASLGTLKPFVAVRQGEGLLVNPPAAFVFPRKVQFLNGGEGTTRHQIHSITIRLGITGSDPIQLAKDCVAYVQAVDAAIWASFPGAVWQPGVMQPFVMEHDYGALFAKQGGGLAYWPEIHVAVGVEELP